ncbi:MAG: RidA family protein [Chloroflexi bacterium]|nr:RidA family protein [Chloroflexota bacterium]
MTKTALNPPELFNSRQYGFSQIVVAEGRRTLYFSGQVAWDENQQIAGKDDFAAQTYHAFKNLETAVTLAGATMADVVSLRIYIVQEHLAASKPVSDNLKRFFPGDSPPAATWIGVYGLANPDFLIEVEAVVMFD